MGLVNEEGNYFHISEVNFDKKNEAVRITTFGYKNYSSRISPQKFDNRILETVGCPVSKEDFDILMKIFYKCLKTKSKFSDMVDN